MAGREEGVGERGVWVGEERRKGDMELREGVVRKEREEMVGRRAKEGGLGAGGGGGRGRDSQEIPTEGRQE